MNQKIICHLLLWPGIVLLLLSVWNTWGWIPAMVGIVLISASYFFTDEAIERRFERRTKKIEEESKKKHPELWKKHNKSKHEEDYEYYIK